MRNQQKIKVLVIGAGLSGLSAADQILRKNSLVQVTVFQALDRVGGKTFTTQIMGIKFDLGAQFIGKNQKYVIQLANRAQQQFIPQNTQGKKVIFLNGKRSIYKSLIPSNINIFNLLEIQKIIWKINRMSKRVSSLDPNNCQLGNYWDSLTIQSWIQKNAWFENTKQLVSAAIRVLLGCQINQVSFLYLLWFVHQNQSFDNLVNIENGLQQKKLKNGTQSLSFFLEQEIKKKGGQILLNQTVQNIIQTSSNVKIITNDKKQYEGSYLILAVSPAISHKISFSPPLSPSRLLIQQKSFMGKLTKVIVLYDKQYWKQKGYSGQIVSNSFDVPIISCFDDTKIKQNGQKVPALIFFIGGQVYRFWKNNQQLQSVVLNKLSQAFECPQLKNPLAIRWHKFDDYQTLGGGPVGVMPPGTLSHIKNLRNPQKLIYFASTQLATCSLGYMDGAIQSGYRAANQVLQNIKNQQNQQQQNRINVQFEKNDEKSQKIKWYNKLLIKARNYSEWI